MTYHTIQPPFTLNIAEMSKQELKDYFRWFLEILPERIHEMTETVRQTPGFESWRPDETPASLNRLGDWFATQVETRLETEEERAIRLALPFEIPNEELTNRSLSLSMDVGMYLSQVLLKNHPSIRWEQPLKPKSFIDYGQPVLIGFGVVPLNPVRVALMLAYGLVRKEQSGKRLREIYDIWSSEVAES